MSKHAKPKSKLQKALSALASAALLVPAIFAGTMLAPAAANATSTVTVGSVELDFSSAKRTASNNPTTLNGTSYYTNVATIDGVQIDARVTTVGISSATIDNYDAIGSASGNDSYFQINNTATAIGGYTSFQFDFIDHADGSPAILKDVSVTSIDLDSPGRQFTEFNGFQSYILSTDTKLTTYTTNEASAALPSGLVRFTQTRGSNAASSSNDPWSAVQVKFTEMSSYVAKFGNEAVQGGYFGVAFKSLCNTATGSACTAAAAQANPNNSPPTSQNTTRYYDLSQPATLFLDNFPYTDAENNTYTNVRIDTLPASGTLEYFNGTSWVTAPHGAGTSIPVSAISLGYVRYTGSGSSFTYSVNDGTLYQTAPSTLTVVGAANGQTITFNNPGNKTPNSAAFASGATATSGLTVVLKSLTPLNCSVSGLNITPLAAGACTIVASQPGNSSYGAAENVTQTFFLSTDAAQTITLANPGAQTWSGSSFTIPRTPTATSGLAVTLTSFSPLVCTVTGSTITIVGPGTCSIRATQGGGVNGGTTYAAAPPVTINFTVAAPVAPTNFTITYSANGATSGSAPADTTGNGSVTLASNSSPLAKTGYTFGGWNTLANGTGTTYAEAASYTLNADVTLYAKWTLNVYTITYSANGATSGSAPADTTGNGSVTLASNSSPLAKTGYTFEGWNTLANGTGTNYAEAASYTLNADVTLYAKWTVVVAPSVYTITYDVNGATSGSAPADTTGNGSVTLASNSSPLAKTGYTFTGWNTLANGTGTRYLEAASYTLNADLTLYAEWTAVVAPAVYTITYDSNNPTSGTAPADTTGNGSVTLALNTGTLAKTGFVFVGWNTQADGKGTNYLVGANYILGGDVTLYARYAAPVKIVYNANGANGGSTPGVVNGAGTITTANNVGNLIKMGMKFIGWNTKADGTGTHYDPSQLSDLEGDIVLYAEWVPVKDETLAETGGTLPIGVTLFGLALVVAGATTLARSKR